MLRRTISTSLVLMCAATTALASFGGGGSAPPPSPPSNPPPSASSAQQTPRQQAEQVYALGYEEVAKAKKDVVDGKAKNAEKKFKRALERGERAVELDPNYHEAWNLVGYCARKVGQVDKAFTAYGKALDLKPDYAPALEYLGEAWLEKGDAKKAREQLAVLEKIDAAEAKSLKEQIEKYESAHPAATPAADSTSAAGSGGR